MLTQRGARAMNQRKMYGWVERFKAGRTSVTEEHVQRVDVLIRGSRQITLGQVAALMGINYGSAQAIAHNDNGYRKVCGC